MSRLNPLWVDITWGAGGSTASLTLEITQHIQMLTNLDVMMHLTCTNMTKELIDEALEKCKEYGVRNILALRGDAPHGQEKWTSVEGGFEYASDLVKYIKEKYGDYFCIVVAGYPETHLECDDPDKDIENLKKKIDAGAEIVITQLFFDTQKFLDFKQRCEDAEITVPIIPGIMPIQAYAGFKRMTSLCKTYVPEKVLEEIELIKDDEKQVKEYGIKYCTEMCEELMSKGINFLHFYTLNLEKTVGTVINNLGIVRI